ncbi:MAG: hypothetical protein E6H48_10825 [Betaproteobacteria bacterium]|nr:MAG: hypothetical protein E6H48_10825 [Betaproteobacteria bacterium]
MQSDRARAAVGQALACRISSGQRSSTDGAPPAALRNQLQALGFEQGKDIVYEGRWAEARNARLPALAAKLLALKVE